MEKELMPDYASEAFYRYLIPPNVFEWPEKPKIEVKPRVVFNKKGFITCGGLRIKKVNL